MNKIAFKQTFVLFPSYLFLIQQSFSGVAITSKFVSFEANRSARSGFIFSLTPPAMTLTHDHRVL